MDDIHIERLEPTSDDSPIAGFLQKKGEGFHHIAYRIDDIDGQLGMAWEHGCRLINESPLAGAGGKQVAFLYPKAHSVCSPSFVNRTFLRGCDRAAVKSG